MSTPEPILIFLYSILQVFFLFWFLYQLSLKKHAKRTEIMKSDIYFPIQKWLNSYLAL